MAIFSRKSQAPQPKEAKQEEAAPAVEAVFATQPNVVSVGGGLPMLILPRLSEKASAQVRLNKYVFKVGLNANKIEIRKAIEKSYGVKVAAVNIVRMEGKSRRYGKFQGKTSGFKKAIVTLTKDSKKIATIEAP